MNYTQPNQLLVRYDQDKLMIGGGAAEKLSRVLRNPVTYDFRGWRGLQADQRTPENIGRFVCEASYRERIDGCVASLREEVDRLNKPCDQPKYEVVFEEGVMLSRALVDAFFDKKIGEAETYFKTYSKRLDELEQRLFDYKKIPNSGFEDGRSIKIASEFDAFEKDLNSRGKSLPSIEGYARNLSGQSFRMEYQGRAGELIGLDQVLAEYSGKEQEYNAKSVAIKVRFERLKETGEYQALIADKKEIEKQRKWLATRKTTGISEDSPLSGIIHFLKWFWPSSS
jgi:hypothetical protein